jgi:hypothetical protein
MELASFLEEGRDRGGNLAEVLDEPTIEVGQSQKHSYVVHRLRLRPFGDSAHLGGVHLYSFRANNESQEFNFLHMKLTFAWFQVQSGFS